MSVVAHMMGQSVSDKPSVLWRERGTCLAKESGMKKILCLVVCMIGCGEDGENTGMDPDSGVSPETGTQPETGPRGEVGPPDTGPEAGSTIMDGDVELIGVEATLEPPDKRFDKPAVLSASAVFERGTEQGEDVIYLTPYWGTRSKFVPGSGNEFVGSATFAGSNNDLSGPPGLEFGEGQFTTVFKLIITDLDLSYGDTISFEGREERIEGDVGYSETVRGSFELRRDTVVPSARITIENTGTPSHFPWSTLAVAHSEPVEEAVAEAALSVSQPYKIAEALSSSTHLALQPKSGWNWNSSLIVSVSGVSDRAGNQGTQAEESFPIVAEPPLHSGRIEFAKDDVLMLHGAALEDCAGVKTCLSLIDCDPNGGAIISGTAPYDILAKVEGQGIETVRVRYRATTVDGVPLSNRYLDVEFIEPGARPNRLAHASRTDEGNGWWVEEFELAAPSSGGVLRIFNPFYGGWDICNSSATTYDWIEFE